MQLPRTVIRIYRRLPLPSGVKRGMRHVFYASTVPLVKIKRTLFNTKAVDFGDVAEVVGNKEHVGIVECKSGDGSPNYFFAHPLMYFVPTLIEEIFHDDVYLKHHKIAPGSLVLDVGANIGMFSALASRDVGPSGRVLAIEADPTNVDYLQWNTRLNRCENTTVIDKAVHSTAETITFYVNELNSAASSTTAGHNTSIQIQADTLDSMCEEHLRDFQGEVFVKMDIEGAEVEAIKGMDTLLRHPRVKGVIAAYHKLYPENIKAHTLIEPVLKEKGFRVINEDGFLYFER